MTRQNSTPRWSSRHMEVRTKRKMRMIMRTVTPGSFGLRMRMPRKVKTMMRMNLGQLGQSHASHFQRTPVLPVITTMDTDMVMGIIMCTRSVLLVPQ